MSVIRGTTPDFTLVLPNYSLIDKTVYVTIKQANALMTLTGDQLDVTADNAGSTIIFSMSQENTLDFNVGGAEIQVKAIDATGHVDATEIGNIILTKALLEQVIEYAEN